jgi:hypothetical protein
MIAFSIAARCQDGHRNDDHSSCVHCDLLNQCAVINRNFGKGTTDGRILRAAVGDVKRKSRVLLVRRLTEGTRFICLFYFYDITARHIRVTVV